MILKKLLAFTAMAGIAGAFVAADLALLYRTYLRADYVRAELESYFGRPVKLGDLTAGVFSGVVASGFEVPGRDRADFLKAERIRITLDKGKLMDGEVSIAAVELHRPLVRLEMDKEGNCELLEFIADVAGRAGTEGAKTGAIPKVHVRHGTLVFSHAAFVKAGVPLTVQNVDANILPFGPGEFVVDGTADAGDLGIWKIDGRINTDSGRLEIRFSTQGLVVGEQTVAGFSEEVGRAYRTYNLKGPVDASVRFTHDAKAARPVQLRAELTARGIEITYANFPYRVVNVEGQIALKDDGIEFHEMRARMWMKDGVETAEEVPGQAPAEIWMNGMTDGYLRESAYKLYFDIRNLPVTPKLRAALQSGAQNVYDMFSPSGSVSGKVEVVKEPGPDLPIVHNIEMEMQSCSATFKPFPYPVTDATGKIILRGDDLRIIGARCRHKEAWFDVDAHLSSIEPDGSIEVMVSGKGIPLDEEARVALPEAVRSVWTHFKPEGKIDLAWKTTRAEGPDKELEYDVTIQPRGLKASYDGVPYPLTDLKGEVWTNAKEVRIDRLAGKHGSANVAVRGTVKGLDRDLPAYELTIDAEEVPIDGELRAALPDEFATMILDIGLKGVVKIDKLSFRKGTEGMRAGQMEYNAKGISLFDASFDAGLEFRDAVAELGNLQGRIDDDQHRLTAQLRPSRLRVEDLSVTNLTGNVMFAGGQLSLQDLEGSCYDGTIKGFVIFIVDTAEHQTSLNVVDIDLLQLTKDTSYAGKNITGKVSGELNLTGTGGDSNSFNGSGQLALKDSELWEVPVFVGIFTKLSLGKKDKFESGFVRFGIDKGTRKLKVRELKFDSRSLKLTSEKGWMDFDGNMRMILHPNFERSGLPALFLKIFDQLIEGTLAISVKGTFKQPDVSVEPSVDILRLIDAK